MASLPTEQLLSWKLASEFRLLHLLIGTDTLRSSSQFLKETETKIKKLSFFWLHLRYILLSAFGIKIVD